MSQTGTASSSHGSKLASLSGLWRGRSVCTIRPYPGLVLGVLREPIQLVVVRELFCEAKPSDKQRSEGPTRQ